MRRIERQAETPHVSRYIRRLLSALEEQEDVHFLGLTQESGSSVNAEHVL